MRHSPIARRGWATRDFRWHVLGLACAFFVLAGLVFLAGSTSARTLSAGSHAAAARAELGYPSILDKLGHSRSMVPAGTSSGAADPATGSQLDQSCWSVVDSPNPDPSLSLNQFNAVDSASPNDIWAVGLYC